MKFFQVTLFSILVSMTGLAHADAKLDKFLDKCEQVKEQYNNAVEEDKDAAEQWHACHRGDGICEQEWDHKRSTSAKRGSLQGKWWGMQQECSDARSKKEAEEQGLGGK